ncbi:MAG: DNA primase [Candidatus Omnitrophica bacterium]|nr:DNA primase [Candidatus Omnitrophota bacterium]
MNKISDEFLDNVLQRNDIAEIIAGYIPLRKAGRNFKALCPFHHEKTPSFVVSPDKQIFHCFGCGAGGDALSFVMKYERMEFPEAVKFLAEKAGLKTVFDEDREDSKKVSFTTFFYKVHELAAVYFQKNLEENTLGKNAREYLLKRAVSAVAIKMFRIGYAADDWDGLLNFLRKNGINDALLLRSGLVIKNTQGRMYDRFRNRVIFPIFNSQSKIVGFGGRLLEVNYKNGSFEEQPKYINSPETEIYNKGKTLYGFNFSKNFIQGQDSCIIVEGYLDFITPFQAGVKNLVASSGTAFTVDQIRILKRYTNNIIIVFDADKAGEEAALRSLDLLVEEAMHVKVARLETGMDPDLYIRKYGPEKFNAQINAAKSLFDYKLNWLYSKFSKDTPEGKSQIAAQMLSTIHKIKDAVLRASYIRNLSQQLNIDEDVLLLELKKVSTFTHGEPINIKTQYNKVSSVSKIAENMLMSLLFEDITLVEELKKILDYSEFKDPVIRKIAKCLFDADWEKLSPRIILQKLGDEDINSFVSSLMLSEVGANNRKKSFADCVKKIKKSNIQLQLDALQRQIQSMPQAEVEKISNLQREFNSLKKEQKLHERTR